MADTNGSANMRFLGLTKFVIRQVVLIQPRQSWQVGALTVLRLGYFLTSRVINSFEIPRVLSETPNVLRDCIQ